MVNEVMDISNSNPDQPENLWGLVEEFRKRFSTITIETLVTDEGTRLQISLLGDVANQSDRQLLIRNFAEAVPQGFSVLGVPEHKPDDNEGRNETTIIP